MVFDVIIVAKLCITTANDNRAILRWILRFFNVLDGALVECPAPATKHTPNPLKLGVIFYSYTSDSEKPSSVSQPCITRWVKNEQTHKTR